MAQGVGFRRWTQLEALKLKLTSPGKLPPLALWGLYFFVFHSPRKTPLAEKHLNSFLT
jgi:hypothetical protein